MDKYIKYGRICQLSILPFTFFSRIFSTDFFTMQTTDPAHIL